MTDNLSDTTENCVPQSLEEGDGPHLDNSPGSQLRRAREAAGLSREELSRRLCMTGNKLELLENDEYERLPNALYVRGYIRNMCKELRIDAAPVLESFSGYCSAEEETREIVAHIRREPLVRERKRGLGGLALLPLLLVAGVFWWMYGRDATPPAVFAEKPASDRFAGSGIESAAGISAANLEVASAGAEEMLNTVPEAPALSGVEGEGLAEDPATEVAPVDGEGAAADTGPEQETAAEPAEISQPSAEVAAPTGEPTELRLTFDEDSWVEIKDASGAVLLAKLKPAGSEVVLSGLPPFELMLGNARGAQVRYRGELIDSAPIGNRRTRRLTVGE